MGKRIVIIGSGVGGSAAAALLAGRGHEVTLLESNPFVGGRCAAPEKDGFHYDFGVHMFSRGGIGPLGEVNRRVGGDLAWVNKEWPCRVKGKVEFDFPLDIKPLTRQVYLARKLKVKARNLPGAFFMFRSLLKGKEAEGNDAITAQEFVSRYTDDEMVHLFVNCLCQLYFALSYKEAAAGEFIWCFTRMFNEAGFGYPLGSGGRIPGSYTEAMVRSGGALRLGETVKVIRVEGNRVQAVETDAGEYPADLVISNVGQRTTMMLAGQEHFTADSVRAAEDTRDSNAYITIKYALEKPVIEHPVVFCMPETPAESIFDYVDEGRAPDDPYIFMPVPSNWDPALAPQGKQLVIAGTAAPSNASDALCNAILDRVHDKVCALFPAVEKATMWQIRSTADDARELTTHRAGECIGLAQVPGQVGRDRPGHRTQVEGLYLVGADAGSRGIGTELAAGSALNLVDSLQQ
jgi:phytoene dehydrogenase-like protein